MLETIATQVSAGLGQARIYEVTEAARKVVEEANTAKNEFLAVVSHELR
jgi:signal transduction histidine kinase